MIRKFINLFVLPMTGVLLVGCIWWAASTWISTDLPSPRQTWQESKIYIFQPFEKRGEMDQGIGLLAYYSLVRVSKGLPWLHRSAFCWGSPRRAIGYGIR